MINLTNLVIINTSKLKTELTKLNVNLDNLDDLVTIDYSNLLDTLRNLQQEIIELKKNV